MKRMCIVLERGTELGRSPCGACRQVIHEFCHDKPETEICIADPEGNVKIATMWELLPDPFVL